jgi:hypothetical protein
MIVVSGERAQEISDSLEKMEEEIENSEPVQRFIRISEAVKAYTDKLNLELANRGYSNVQDVKEDGVLAEILAAAGPAPDIDKL